MSLIENGIYIIKNVINGKVYIGSAFRKDGIYGRIKHHKSRLKTGSHVNSHLQNAWNKYGESAFKFEILQVVFKPEILIQREQYFIDLYESYNPIKGYNICKKAGITLGYKHTENNKKLMSQLAKNKVLSETHKINIGRAVVGKKRTQETKNKMSKWQIGKLKSPQTRENISKSLINLLVGEKNGNSKITNQQANEIRELYNENKISRKELANRFSICKSSVDNILNNKTYKKIEII